MLYRPLCVIIKGGSSQMRALRDYICHVSKFTPSEPRDSYRPILRLARCEDTMTYCLQTKTLAVHCMHTKLTIINAASWKAMTYDGQHLIEEFIALSQLPHLKTDLTSETTWGTFLLQSWDASTCGVPSSEPALQIARSQHILRHPNRIFKRFNIIFTLVPCIFAVEGICYISMNCSYVRQCSSIRMSLQEF